MAEVLLFHHVMGQTPGFFAFADELRQAGHTVHTPNLLDGRTFDSIDEGLAYVGEIGFGEVIGRGDRAASELPEGLVYGGGDAAGVPGREGWRHRRGRRG